MSTTEIKIEPAKCDMNNPNLTIVFEDDVSERYHECPNCGLYSNSLFPHCISRPSSRSGYEADTEWNDATTDLETDTQQNNEVTESPDGVVREQVDDSERIGQLSTLDRKYYRDSHPHSHSLTDSVYEADDEDSYVMSQQSECVWNGEIKEVEAASKSVS